MPNDLSSATGGKKYYDVLDGLRGIAAIAVVLFHYCEMVNAPRYDQIPIGHGYLAVDFFFCLSGFVIGFAYDGRMQLTGLGTFFKNRFIRLHPMVVMGTLLGVISYVADPWMELSVGWGTVAVAALCSLLMIPYPGIPHRTGELFPFNTPIWSLFFEYIANIVYALVLVRLRKNALLVLGILAAGFLVYAGHDSGWLINGWGIDNMRDGFARVAFSFTAGLVIYRFGWIWKNRGGLVLPGLLLLAMLCSPHRTGDWMEECLIVIAAFPVIVSIGAGAVVHGLMRKICLFLGRISYPLYLTHVVVVTLFHGYYYSSRPEGAKLFAVIGSLCLFNILTAWVVLKFYDEPVRRWLNRKIGKRPVKV